MILLISAAKNAVNCVSAVEKNTGERVQLVQNLSAGSAMLRGGEFSAVVVDQAFVDLNPISADVLWKHTGTAIPVFVNFAISGAERLVRDVLAALSRREKERVLATKAAETALRSELNGAVTGILLSSELALALPSLPVGVVNKLQSVHELALQIRTRLGNVA
ncbi:MAG: hypothetical protein JWO20_3249 [Candidatus Angelobacter sp.]|nr:hypothetical protein [Candidatus Angelobacter sp.]